MRLPQRRFTWRQPHLEHSFPKLHGGAFANAVNDAEVVVALILQIVHRASEETLTSIVALLVRRTNVYV